MRYPRRKGELIQPEDSERWAVYEPSSDSLHALNESARAIWELCDGQTSPEEMARAITELTGVPLEQARSDVLATIDTLESLGLAEFSQAEKS